MSPGHAPFTVNSGTKVANLNADKLDGLDSTSFVPGSKLRRVGPIVDTVPPSGGFFDSPIATVGHFTFKGHCGFLPLRVVTWPRLDSLLRATLPTQPTPR